MTRLWSFDEYNEPWLENGSHNPPLIIVNPKKGQKKMARSKYARRKSRARSTGRKNAPRRRRRTTRRNPWAMAGPVVGMNRPRKHRRGRRNSPKRRRRSGYRRNPALLGISLPPMQSVIYAGVGFVGVPMMEGFLMRFLPVSLTASPIGKYAARIGSVLGLAYLTKMVIGAQESKMVAIGGGAYVLTSAITEFAPGLIPAGGMNAYRPASLSAYAGSTGRTFNQLGALDFGAQNTVRSAPFGGSRIIAQRFRRFQ